MNAIRVNQPNHITHNSTPHPLSRRPDGSFDLVREQTTQSRKHIIIIICVRICTATDNSTVLWNRKRAIAE